MSIFKKKTPTATFDYDSKRHKAVLKCNTCNRDRVFGFIDKETGRLHEIAVIKDDKELKTLMDLYGISDIETRY